MGVSREEHKKELDKGIIDAIMERPYPFTVDGKLFYMYPLTLGKTFIVQEMAEQMGLQKDNILKNADLEFLRMVKEKKDICCELMAYITARNDYYDVFDYNALEQRKSVFMKLPDEDLASFVIITLTTDKMNAFIKHIGLDKEQSEMKKVMDVKAKNDKNNYTFGGLSIYGSLIDAAMERYGLTKRQVVWEIDYVSLRMLLADKINTIYVTDEERKKLRVSKDRTRVKGDDKEAMMKAIQSQGWD